MILEYDKYTGKIWICDEATEERLRRSTTQELLWLIWKGEIKKMRETELDAKKFKKMNKGK